MKKISKAIRKPHISKAQVEQGRVTAVKVAAAYKAGQQGMKWAGLAADRWCHSWEIDSDYYTELHDAANELVTGSRSMLPRLDRMRVRQGYDEDGHDFNSKGWAWLPVPGISRLMQVRTKQTTIIEFRAARRADLEAIKTLIEARAAQMSEESGVRVNPFDDFPQHTAIFAWDNAQKDWKLRAQRVARSFNSVILTNELQGEIVSDLTGFVESKGRLTRLELPWRRGYLLSGPPGTGKTSLSLAIAGTLQFNLYSLSLTDIDSDGMLRQAVGSLRANSVLVIEDIDAYSVSHDRDHNAARDGKLSLSGLLNSLDGFETPNGLVTIVTTNHVDKLDPALVRSGRLDRMFHLGNMNGPEIERLFAWFYEQLPPSPAPEGMEQAALSPAEVTEFFKQNLNDPEKGWNAVLEAFAATVVSEPTPVGFQPVAA